MYMKRFNNAGGLILDAKYDNNETNLIQLAQPCENNNLKCVGIVFESRLIHSSDQLNQN